MKWANRILLILNVLMAASLLCFLMNFGARTLAPGAWEYKDLVAVLLTVVTVVLAFIGLIIGGAAIWGYQSIKGIAEQKAHETSRVGFNDYVSSESFRLDLNRVIQSRMESLAKEAVQDALSPIVVSSETAPEYHEPSVAKANDKIIEVEPSKKGDVPWQD